MNSRFYAAACARPPRKQHAFAIIYLICDTREEYLLSDFESEISWNNTATDISRGRSFVKGHKVADEYGTGG